MSKKNQRNRPTLIIPSSEKGGIGKTLTCVALANYLRDQGNKVACFDYDTGNQGDTGCLAHWCNGNVNLLSLRVWEHRDRLLVDAAESGADYVVADFPANSIADLETWLESVATPELIDEMGLGIIAVPVVTPESSTAKSAVRWISKLQNRATYLVALNHIDYEPIPTPSETLFKHWHAVALPLLADVIAKDRISTFEIPFMEPHGMEAMTKLGKWPSIALASNELHLLHRSRVKNWTKKIAEGLDATGLFTRQEQLLPAQAQ
jgi:hypothetical protein